jgi:hypothetical protein
MSANSNLPTYDLEMRAAEERKRLSNTVDELKDRVREKVDVKTNVRKYAGTAVGVSAVIALLFGYGVAGMFTRH